jgi:hypothetical protein
MRAAMTKCFVIALFGVGLTYAQPASAQRYITMEDTPVDPKTLALLEACVADARKNPAVEHEVICTEEEKDCDERTATRAAHEKASNGKSHIYDSGEGMRAECVGPSAQQLLDRWLELGTKPSFTSGRKPGLDACTCSQAQDKYPASCEIAVDDLKGTTFECYGKIENTTWGPP